MIWIYLTLQSNGERPITQKEIQNRFLRMKSFMWFDEKWGNKKDLVYSRWFKQVMDLQLTWKYEDFEKKFYFWKLSQRDWNDFETSTLYREFLHKKIIQPDFLWKLYFEYKILWKKIPETCSKKLILFLSEMDEILQKS
jgi:hypothetical protein